MSGIIFKQKRYLIPFGIFVLISMILCFYLTYNLIQSDKTLQEIIISLKSENLNKLTDLACDEGFSGLQGSKNQRAINLKDKIKNKVDLKYEVKDRLPYLNVFLLDKTSDLKMDKYVAYIVISFQSNNNNFCFGEGF